MWRLASKAFAGKLGFSNSCTKSNSSNPDCSDDEASSCASKEDGLDCPICWESFNIVENVPYVLWCGHTLCKNCVLGLQSATVKLPTIPIRLPLFISCPWCNVLSFRVIYKGSLRFPRKNYFLLWMVERMNGDRQKSQSSTHGQCHTSCPSSSTQLSRNNAHHRHNQVGSPVLAEQPNSSQTDAGIGIYFSTERIQATFRNSLAFIIEQTAKIPLVVIFLIIVLYAIPASAAVLVLYILITVLFAVPSILILYFAYPSLDWLVREILT
ncbi:hypothetical protein Cni_G10426 [Canna indica]|uniref:RING-type domain-containing protein n=1 Tax=Canna indica TaxID=4628 RepID=A0AAQ3Q8K3_9LILI|nr:hypothetical protein Cni_G10426 [Canna indica]